MCAVLLTLCCRPVCCCAVLVRSQRALLSLRGRPQAQAQAPALPFDYVPWMRTAVVLTLSSCEPVVLSSCNALARWLMSWRRGWRLLCRHANHDQRSALSAGGAVSLAVTVSQQMVLSCPADRPALRSACKSGSAAWCSLFRPLTAPTTARRLRTHALSLAF